MMGHPLALPKAQTVDHGPGVSFPSNHATAALAVALVRATRELHAPPLLRPAPDRDEPRPR